MTAVSQNVYRTSWLAMPARLACLPLTLLFVLGGTLWRILALAPRLLRASDPERGLADGAARVRAFLWQGLRYAAFGSDVLPPLDGRVVEATDTPGPWHQARRRLAKSHVAMASTVGFVLYLYVGVAAQAGWIAPAWREATKGAEYVAPGKTAEKDGQRFALGTDFQGRDVLDLTLRGTTTALWIGLFAALISCVIGVFLGALAGYFGGWLDDAIVWVYTTLDSIPYLLLLIAFSFAFKNNPDIRDWYDATFLKQDWDVSLGLFSIILVVGTTSWVGVCRIVRAEFIKHRDRDYVLAARSMGLPTSRILFRHILPNVFHLVLISFSLLFVGAIKFEVILSFLGLGMEPGEASWGSMIGNGAQELLRAEAVWWQLTAATVALFGLVLCVNLFADALRDALDPRVQH
jgi:peptide/nickel transport system permease protein